MELKEKIAEILYDMIYLLTAIGLSSGGSTHLHTNNTENTKQTIHRILGKNCHHPVYFPKNETYSGHNIRKLERTLISRV